MFQVVPAGAAPPATRHARPVRFFRSLGAARPVAPFVTVPPAAGGGSDLAQCETAMTTINSFGSRATLDVAGTRYTMYRLDALRAISGSTVDRLP